MANGHVERYSASVIIRDMQIKATLRCHLTLVRMAIIKKSSNYKCWRGCGEKGTLLYCWWECKLVQPVWRFLKITESCHMIQQPHSWAYIWRKPHFEKIHVPQFSLQHYLQQPRHGSSQMSIIRWINKDVVHIYNSLLLRHKKEWNNAICSNMDRPRDYHIK